MSEIKGSALETKETDWRGDLAECLEQDSVVTAPPGPGPGSRWWETQFLCCHFLFPLQFYFVCCRNWLLCNYNFSHLQTRVHGKRQRSALRPEASGPSCLKPHPRTHRTESLSHKFGLPLGTCQKGQGGNFKNKGKQVPTVN